MEAMKKKKKDKRKKEWENKQRRKMIKTERKGKKMTTEKMALNFGYLV